MIRALILCVLFLATSLKLFAQPAVVDATYNPTDTGPGLGELFNSKVTASALQNDGKIILAGSFTSYAGIQKPYIVRIGADGALDPTFNFSETSLLWENTKAILVLPDNRMLIAGTNGVSRLSSTGQLDATFSVNLGNAGVAAMIRQSDGKIVIAGGFTQVNGVSRTYVARINADGTTDTSFNPGTGPNNAFVYSLALTSDEKILVGGGFTSFNGTARNRIVRLNTDGSVDSGFNPGTGVNNAGGPSVRAIKVLPGGKALLGGMITNYNGTTVNMVVRIESTGLLDATFTSALTPFEPQAMEVDENGKIIVSGFTIQRLNDNGSLDNSFSAATPSSAIFTHQLLPGGKILVAGNFERIGTIGRRFVAVLEGNGTVDPSWNTGKGAKGGSVLDISAYDNNKFLVAGGFTHYNGTAVNGLALVGTDGAMSPFFLPGTGVDGQVYTTAKDNNGLILVGGYFTKWNGTTRHRLARIDAQGTLDAGFNDGSGFGGNAGDVVEQIVVQPDNKVLVGGDFSSFDGTARTYLLRLDNNGNLDAAFNPAPNSDIFAIALQSDNKILVGGWFTQINGVSRSYLTRLNADGTADASFVPGTGPNDVVRSIAIQSDGKIIIGGWFTSYNGTARKNIARLNTDGTLDTSFDPGVGFAAAPSSYVDINGIVVEADGKIIVGGDFHRYQNVNARYLVRINTNGSIDSSFDTTTGGNGRVEDVFLLGDKIMIGGSFTSFNGTGKSRAARLFSACDALVSPSVPVVQANRTEKCQSEGGVTLTITSGTLHPLANWKWYSGSCGGTAAGTGATINVNPGVTTTYYVREEGGCVAPGTCVSITITVKPTPVLQFQSTASRCGEGSITLEASAGDAAIRWSDALDVELGTGPSYATPILAVGAPSMFYVRASKDGCASQQGTITATALVKPQIIARNNASRCGPGQVLLTAQASAGNLAWYEASTGGSSIATGNNFNTPSLTTTTTYYIEATQGSCSSGRTDVVATIAAIPEVSIATTDVLTASVSQATGPFTYEWKNCETSAPVPGQTSTTFKPSVTGSYTVTVKTTDNCTGTATCQPFTVVGLVDELPATMFYPNPSTGSIFLDLSSASGPVDVTLTDVWGRVIYSEWQTTARTRTVQVDEKGMFVLSVVDGGRVRRGKVLVK